jgi:hypothetical protein
VDRRDFREAYRIGGSGDDEARAIAVGGEGHLLVAGATQSADFPVVAALQPGYGGSGDAFVLDLDTTSGAFACATYMGGTGADEAAAIASDRSGAIYVAGRTQGLGFPVRHEVGGAGLSSGSHVFVSKLAPGGSSLEYSSCLGGDGDEAATALGLSRRGALWVAGSTTSRTFPPAEATKDRGCSRDGFAVRLDPSGEAIAESVRLQGDADDSVSGLALGPDGRIVLAGTTDSWDLAEAQILEPLSSGASAFLTVFTAQAPAFVCDRTFDGGPTGTGTAWGIAQHWNPDGTPTSTEDVCISGSFPVVINSSAWTAAALQVTSSAALTIAGGSLDLASASTIGSGGLSVGNANLTGAGDLTVSGPITWTGGTMSGAGRTYIDGGMTIGGSVSLGRRLVNNTNVTWTAGGLTMDAGGIVDNEPSALFEVRPDSGLGFGGGAPQFNNRGTFRRSTGAGDFIIQGGIVFANTGRADVLTGRLRLNAGYTQPGGTMNLDGGALLSSIPVTIDGGTFEGHGTATSDIVNEGAVSPGPGPAMLNIAGTYTQAQRGIVDIDLHGTTPGTSHDQVNVVGNSLSLVGGHADLDGTLNVALTGGFCPQAGDSFTIMTFGSRTGTFDTINLPAPCSCRAWVVTYGPTSLVLSVVQLPAEIGGVTFDADRTTLRWTASPIRPGTVYDVVRGALDELPVGRQVPAETETCVATGTSATSTTDGAVPSPGKGYWYVARERVDCAIGTYGYASGGPERITTTCP